MDFNIVDVIIIILVGLGAVKGYRRGFFGSLVGLFGTLFALLITVKTYKPVVEFLEEKFALLEIVHGFLVKNLPLPLEVSTAPLNAQGLSILADRIQNMFLPLFLKEKIMSLAFELSFTVAQMGITTVGELLNYVLAILFINGLVFLLLWFIISAGMRLISKLLTDSLDDTILGSLNRLAGLVVGTTINIVVLMVVIGVMSTFFGNIGQAANDLPAAWVAPLEKSVLLPYFMQAYGLILSKSISVL